MAVRMLILLLLPFLAYAQNSTNSASSSSQSSSPSPSPSPSQVVITSTFVTSGSTLVFTTTQPISTSNSTVSSNSTGNATTSSTPTSTVILPTAPSTINGGSGLAPSPGQTGAGGIYGPSDQYISAATSLARQALTVGLVGSLIGGTLVLL